MNPTLPWIEKLGPWAPWAFLLLFLDASFLMIWRLECLGRKGFEGTVLGTLIMPYCSGIGNLALVYVVDRSLESGREVLINCLVNNITNLTLLIGLPALFWSLTLDGLGTRKARKAQRINKLSLLFTMTAVLFFTGALWALSRDGQLDLGDGMVLVGLFAFWQVAHVFEVLKNQTRENRSMSPWLILELVLLGIGAFGVYVSLDSLVAWLMQRPGGFVSQDNLGWLTGWLLVLPNALLAMYYAWRNQPEVTYASQIGDGHICIPLCVGLYALRHPVVAPDWFENGLLLLVGATGFHFLMLTIRGGVPRILAPLLIGAYGFFLWLGLG